jgi:hypothetical protein
MAPLAESRQLSAAKAASNAAGAAAPSAPSASADNAPLRRTFSTTNAIASLAQVEGCYQLTVDRASAAPPVPDRFRLQRDSASGANIVRIQTLRGDSVLSGATWTASATGSVAVSFTNASANANAARVELSFATNRPPAVLTFGGRTLVATIQRNACER